MTNHPDFDDQGVVSWHTDFDTALAEAKKTGKGLFIESGRYACGNCRRLVESVIPRPEVHAYLNEHFVSLADDCDEMAPQVLALGQKHMPAARMLPFIMVTDADGNWLGGSSGAVSAESLLELLRSAVGKMPS